MTAASDLEQTIRSTIPLSESMQFSIAELTANAIIVQAPLAPNVNIHGTGFAGSIYSLAVLTGWALVSHIMSVQSIEGELVVGKAEIKYRKPVTGIIECRSEIDDKRIQQLVRDCHDLHKGRIELEVAVGDRQAVLAAHFFITASA